MTGSGFPPSLLQTMAVVVAGVYIFVALDLWVFRAERTFTHSRDEIGGNGSAACEKYTPGCCGS